MKKQILAIFFAILILTSNINASIYEETTSETISKGVTHTVTKSFYGNSWQNINVVTVDLTAPNIAIKALTSPNGISYLDTVLNQANANKDIVAAVNADFFDITIGGGRSSMLGLTATDGYLLSSPSHDTALAAMAIYDNGIFMDYFSMQLYASTIDGIKQQVLHLNKFHPTASLLMYTASWGSVSRGSMDNCTELVCVYDEDGGATVVEKRVNMEGTAIPKNGFILLTKNDINGFLYDNFQVGSRIFMSTQLSPDKGKIKEAVGGGSILVKDGAVAKFTNVISGTHPRTAAGVSQDGKTLYLVTVDGRNARATGMTQTELAQYMLALGSYNAINFDGGGSTTMVTRSFWNGGLSAINMPSDGSLRRISSSLGVSAVYDGNLAGLKIKGQNKVFVGTGTELSVMGNDKYENAVVLPPDAVIDYSVEGITGKFVKNVFYPGEEGKGIITAKYKDFTAQIEVDALTLARIEPSTKNLELKPSQAGAISLLGFDKNGIKASIRPQDVKFDGGGISTFDVKGITAGKKPAAGVLSFSVNDIISFVGLTVGSPQSIYDYDFEKDNKSFFASSSNATGSYEITTNGSIAKTHIGKLSFDFTAPSENREFASVIFGDGITIPNGSDKIEMCIYSPQEMDLTLSAIVKDSSGKDYKLDFATQVYFKGWSTIYAPIPEELENGLKLTGFSVSQNFTKQSIKNNIFLDDLHFKGAFSLTLPPDIYTKDYMDKEQTIIDGGFKFNVLAVNIGNDTLLNRLIQSMVPNTFDPSSKYNAFVGDYLDDDMVGRNTTAQTLRTAGHVRLDYENASFIVLDNRNTITKADYTQWQWLKDNEETTNKNVFVFLPRPLSGDDLIVFKSLMKEYSGLSKNVYVFYNGENFFGVEDGIRYFGLSDSWSLQGNSLGKFSALKYVTVTVNPSETTYQIKNLK